MAWRRSLAFVAVLGAWAAAVGAQDFRPLKMRLHTVDFTHCRTVASGDSGSPLDVTVSLKIGTDGAVQEFELPKGSPAWLGDLASCAVKGLEFEPEIRHDDAVSTSAQVQLTTTSAQGSQSKEFAVATIGMLITPPRFSGNPSRVLERCLPLDTPWDRMSKSVLTVTVAPDGNIESIEPLVGAPAWLERTANCLQENFKFYPGTRDGVAVTAQAKLPITLRPDDSSSEFQTPKPPSDPQQIEVAYRDCYPADQAAMGSVFFSFDVNIDGSVSNARMVRGSGDPLLDRAGACILPRLRFEPARRGKMPIKSNVTWELPVRPPR